MAIEIDAAVAGRALQQLRLDRPRARGAARLAQPVAQGLDGHAGEGERRRGRPGATSCALPPSRSVAALQRRGRPAAAAPAARCAGPRLSSAGELHLLPAARRGGRARPAPRAGSASAGCTAISQTMKTAEHERHRRRSAAARAARARCQSRRGLLGAAAPAMRGGGQARRRRAAAAHRAGGTRPRHAGAWSTRGRRLASTLTSRPGAGRCGTARSARRSSRWRRGSACPASKRRFSTGGRSAGHAAAAACSIGSRSVVAGLAGERAQRLRLALHHRGGVALDVAVGDAREGLLDQRLDRGARAPRRRCVWCQAHRLRPTICATTSSGEADAHRAPRRAHRLAHPVAQRARAAGAPGEVELAQVPQAARRLQQALLGRHHVDRGAEPLLGRGGGGRRRRPARRHAARGCGTSARARPPSRRTVATPSAWPR